MLWKYEQLIYWTELQSRWKILQMLYTETSYENIEDPQLSLEYTIQIFWTLAFQTQKYCRYESVDIGNTYKKYMKCTVIDTKQECLECETVSQDEWCCAPALDDHHANVLGMVVFAAHLYSKS